MQVARRRTLAAHGAAGRVLWGVVGLALLTACGLGQAPTASLVVSSGKGQVAKLVAASANPDATDPTAAPAMRTFADPDQGALYQEVLKDVPELATQTSPLAVVRLLRNQVYRMSHVAAGGAMNGQFTLATYDSVRSGELPVLCGGMAMTYVALLNLFGIPNHLVATSASFEPGESPDNHVFTEVQVNGQWMVEDPTFNVEWSLDGHTLGASDLRAAFQAGKAPVDGSNGFPLIEGRTVETYYSPYGRLLANMDVDDYEPFHNGTETVLTAMPGPLSWLYADLETPLGNLPAGELVSNWSFVTGSLGPFQVARGTAVKAGSGEAGIQTPASQYGMVIAGPAVALTPGNYVCEVDGSVDAGGLLLRVEDINHNGYLAQGYFQEGQMPAPSGRGITLSFTAPEGASVRVTGANWSLAGGSSSWSLERVSLYRR